MFNLTKEYKMNKYTADTFKRYLFGVTYTQTVTDNIALITVKLADADTIDRLDEVYSIYC